MNEVLLNILKEKPIIIPNILFKNYTKLNLTAEELIILICLINEGDKVLYDPSIFQEKIGMDKFKAMQIISDLADKNIINIKVENNNSGKKEEYIYLDLIYKKIFNLLLDQKKDQTMSTDLFSLFEQELGRTLSPVEVMIIKEWVEDGYKEEMIKEALKEAIYNNVRNLKYIDRILFNWRSKGIKSKADILKEKKNYRKPSKSTEPIYDYNWLEDE